MISLNKTDFSDDQGLYINWIGQAGYLIKMPDSLLICIDPYYSNSIERYEGRDCRRIWYNNFIIEEFNPDLVFCSHDHLDHTDPETLPLIYAYSEAKFFGPETSIKHMEKMKFSKERIELLTPETELKFDSFSLIPKRTYHTEDSLGFLIKTDSCSIYFTGDTALDKSLDFLNEQKVDILICCVNGKYNNMTIPDSVRLYNMSGAQILIPTHYGLIPNNTVSEKEIRSIYEKSGVKYCIPSIEKFYKIERS